MPRKRSRSRRRVRFQVEAEPGSKIFVAGSFNDWNPKQYRLKEKNRVFSTSILLDQGRHEYKFVVNGEWAPDVGCPDWVANDQGTLNSVITVD